MNKITIIKLINLCLIISMVTQWTVPTISSESNNSVDFIVIAPKTYFEALQPFIEYKNINDMDTVLVSIEDILNQNWSFTEAYNGRDDAETLKFFITEAKREWNISYVMLVGGKEQIPIRYARINIDTTSLKDTFQYNNLRIIQQPDMFQMVRQYISDLYFADLFFENGSFCSWDSNNNLRFAEKNESQQIDIVDLTPDIAVGRLLCTSIGEVTSVVQKILDYEKNQINNKPWQHNVTVCGGDTHSLWRDVLIKIAFINKPNVQIAYEGEYMGNIVTDILSDFSAKKIYTTSFDEENTMFVTRENINKAISDGCKFLFMAGHGFPEAWGTHPPSLFGKLWLPGPMLDPMLYRNDDVRKLTNQFKLPVAVISACSCGDFNNTSDPIAWTFVEHNTGGSIASFACSTLGTLLPTTLCPETLNGKLAIGVIDAYNMGEERLGDLWMKSIISYLEDDEAWELGDFPNTFWLNQFNIEEWILFGDPTLEIHH